MSLSVRLFARPTSPDPSSLTSALTPFFGAAGGFDWRYDPQVQKVIIEYGDWTGVDTAGIQTAVTNCIAETDHTDAKTIIENMPTWQLALNLVILDQFNTLRGLHSLQPITKAQLIAAIEAKIDTLT